MSPLLNSSCAILSYRNFSNTPAISYTKDKSMCSSLSLQYITTQLIISLKYQPTLLHTSLAFEICIHVFKNHLYELLQNKQTNKQTKTKTNRKQNKTKQKNKKVKLDECVILGQCNNPIIPIQPDHTPNSSKF